MNKFKVLRIINPVLIVVFLIQVATGVIFALQIDLPHMYLLPEIHEYNGLLMTTLIVIHAILNWGWIKANIFKM